MQLQLCVASRPPIFHQLAANCWNWWGKRRERSMFTYERIANGCFDWPELNSQAPIAGEKTIWTTSRKTHHFHLKISTVNMFLHSQSFELSSLEQKLISKCELAIWKAKRERRNYFVCVTKLSDKRWDFLAEASTHVWVIYPGQDVCWAASVLFWFSRCFRFREWVMSRNFKPFTIFTFKNPLE